MVIPQQLKAQIDDFVKFRIKDKIIKNATSKHHMEENTKFVLLFYYLYFNWTFLFRMKDKSKNAARNSSEKENTEFLEHFLFYHF